MSLQKVLLTFICVLCFCKTGYATGTAEGSYYFGVFPYLSATRLDNIYAPIGAEMGRVLAKPVHFRTAGSFKKFFTRLKEQRYDFAIIQPFWYPPAVDQFGYEPLVRMQEPFTSLIVVLDNSKYKNLHDLKGEVIATPPKFVPVVHMARRELVKRGIVPGKHLEFRAFKSVSSCFQQVLIGAAAGCVAPPFAPAVIEEKMQVKLRVVLKTPAIPNLSLIVHSRVPEHEREKIRQLFIGFNNNEEGKNLLVPTRTKGFIPAIDKEYDVVRSFIKELNKNK